MVEFYDPVEDKMISYHINKNLKKKWDNLRGGLLKKKDTDRVYIVDGRERTGKSVFALQQAKYIDPTFNISRVCFTPEEFLEQIRTAPKGSVIVFDEAFRGLSSKSTQSKVNKMIVQAMMEMGQRNLIVFIVLPTFFLLEMYAAVLRTEVLFHVFHDIKNKRRAFRVYNHQKKTILYHTGKKKGFSYSNPRVRESGNFYNIYAIDEVKYRAKKAKSLKEMGIVEQKVEEENPHLIQRDYLIGLIYHKLKEMDKKWTLNKVTEAIQAAGVNLSRKSLEISKRRYETDVLGRKKRENVLIPST